MSNIVIDTILSRRSVRNYEPCQIDDEALGLILDAGRNAPSGGNSQSSHFIVIQNETVLAELQKLVASEFAKMEITEDMYRSIKSSIIQSKNGNYRFTFNAPTFIIAANKKGYGNAIADCAVALENMMIAASSLNIGTCWINQLKWLDDNVTVREYIEKLGLEKDETVCGGLVLGYPCNYDMPPLKHDGNQVTYIK